jgi:hypothetical protein
MVNFVTSEETKVRNLLKKVTDPTLEAAKQTIKVNEHYKSDFSAAANFLASSVTPLSKHRDHNISSLGRNNGHQGGQGGNNHGRGRG